MPTPRWEDVRRVFLEAIEQFRDGRDEFARQRCGQDEDLYAEVAALLRAHDSDITANESLRTDLEGSCIGPYKVLNKIGEGGFGVVYVAEQEHPIQRHVALKILKEGMDTRQVIARFEAERQTLALMDHPGFARVYDAGATPSGRPYFSMELVHGLPITRFCDEHRLSLTARLELLIRVCHAVHHAHQRGVIHRDIKPSNVLVTVHDGRPDPKVIDFGIAKAITPSLTEKASMTGLRQLLGTPAYMSPEQADSASQDVDTRSDIYALGVLAYELLTGTLPFDPETLARAEPAEALRIIRETDPPKPSSRLNGQSDKEHKSSRERGMESSHLRKSLRGDLDRIVMKAIAKDRRYRYGSTEAFADDLRRYIDGYPVQAAPPGVWYALGKAVRRNRFSFIAAAIVFVSLIGGLAVASWALATVRHERDAARAERDLKNAALGQAETARHLAEFQRSVSEQQTELAVSAQYRATLAAAISAASLNYPAQALHMLREAPETHRGWEWSQLMCSIRPPGTLLLQNPPAVMSRCLALGGGSLVVFSATSKGSRSVIWDSATGEVVRSLDMSMISADRSGRLLAGVRADGTLALVNVADGSVRGEWPAAQHEDWKLGGAPFSPDGDSLIAQKGRRTIICLNTNTGEDVWTRTLSNDIVSRPVLVRIDHPERTHAVRVLTHGTAGRFTFLSPAGEFLPSATPNDVRRHVELYSNRWRWVRDNGTVHTERANRDVYFTSSTHRGDLIAIGDSRGTVHVYRDDPPKPNDTSEPQRFATLRVGDSAVSSLAISDSGRRLCVVTQSGECLSVPLFNSDPLWDFESLYRSTGWSVSPDGARIIMKAWGGLACLDALTLLPIWSVNTGPETNTALAWSADCRMIATTTEGDSCDFFVLDAETGRQIVGMSASPVLADTAIPSGPPPWGGPIRALAFSRDGAGLYVAFAQGGLRVIDTSDWTAHQAPRIQPSVGSDGPSALAVSADGRSLAHLTPTSRPGEANVIFRDTVTLVPTANALVHGAQSLAWNPDDSTLLVGSVRGGLTCLERSDGSERWSATAPTTEPIMSVTHSPDGTRIVAASTGPVIFVFDAQRGAFVASLTGLTRMTLGFARDGALICGALGGQDTLMRLESSQNRFPHFDSFWPSDQSIPINVAEARHRVRQAMGLWRSHRSAPGMEARIESILGDTRHPQEVRSLAAYIGRTFGVQINWWNSDASALTQSPAATQSQQHAAVILLREAIAIHPQSSRLQRNLGMALLRNGKHEQAIVHLRTAAEIREKAGLSRSPELDAAIAECRIATQHEEEPVHVPDASESELAPQDR